MSACLASAPAAIVDGQLANLSATSTTGMDVQAGDSIGGALGPIDLGVTGNYVFKFDQDVTPTSPAVISSTRSVNPLALRLRGTLGWSREGPRNARARGSGLRSNYTGGYKDPGSTLVADVSPWTTVDLRVVYRTEQGSAGSAGWRSH